MSNFIKFRPVGAELFHADRPSDGHDEANSRFSQFCESAKKYKTGQRVMYVYEI
jgi:hypothetical protein